MRSLRASVEALLEDPQDVTLARSILGTDSAQAICRLVEALCREQLGRSVTGCLELSQSVGAVFLVRLDDGSTVALKAHPLGGSRLGLASTLESLLAVYQVQHHLAEQGLPCARVILPPVRWPPGAIAAMERLEFPPSDPPHLPSVRVAMAESLAEVIGRAEPFRDLPHLPRSQLPAGLFPTPHNALFDFTVPGGEWIDERARRARAALEPLPERLVVAHSDYSAENVRVAAGRVTAIFDCDSIGVIDEMRCLGNVALHFTYQPHRPPWSWPLPDETEAFIQDYARARGAPLSALERQRVAACLEYSATYTARCEHSLDPKEIKPGEIRERLRRSS